MQAPTAVAKVVPTPPEAEFEFSDVTGMMCLLCARQFKSLDQLKRHNKESDLHKARNKLCTVAFWMWLTILENRRISRTQVSGR